MSSTKTVVTVEMPSVDALSMTCRALADCGYDYGWNVYYNGNEIHAGHRRRLIESDDSAAHWLDAWDAALDAYKRATGEDWRY